MMFIRIKRPNGETAWLNMDYAVKVDELNNTSSPSLRLVVGEYFEVINDENYGEGMVASIKTWLNDKERTFVPEAEPVKKPEVKRRKVKVEEEELQSA